MQFECVLAWNTSQRSVSLDAVVWRITPHWFLIELRSSIRWSFLLILRSHLLLCLVLLGEFANDHVFLVKDSIALSDDLGFLKFDYFLLVVILAWRVGSNWDSILRHGLHTVTSVVWLTVLTRSLTAAYLSLLSLDTVVGSTCSYLSSSVLLASTCPNHLRTILILIDFSKWTHWSLALRVIAVLIQKTI